MPTASASRIVAIARQKSPDRNRPRSPARELGAPSTTVIPEHLRYKGPSVAQPFGYVESRYRSPPKRVDPNQHIDQRLAASAPKPVPKNSAYAGVLPRYKSPPKERPTEAKKPLERTESVKSTPEYAAHKRSAAAYGMGGVHSRYIESAQRASSPDRTRREEVEAQLEQQRRSVNKNGKPWALRANTAETFEAQRKYNEELRRWESPPKRRDNRPSVVMQYVAGNVDLAPPPERKPKEEAPRMDGQIYLGGGGPVVRQRSPTRQGKQMEEEKVKALQDRLKSSRTSSPPRVAAMVRPAQERRLQEERLEASHHRRGTTSSQGSTSSTTNRRIIRTTTVGAPSSNDATSSRARTPTTSTVRSSRAVTPTATTRQRNNSPPPRARRASNAGSESEKPKEKEEEPVVVHFRAPPPAQEEERELHQDNAGEVETTSAEEHEHEEPEPTRRHDPPVIFRTGDAPRLR